MVGSPGSQPATWVTAFTSMFVHGSFLHILGNMVFLAVFGPSVEDRIGRLRFLAFYLLGGLVALAAQVLVSPDSTSPTIGASGAIAAVLGGYILMYPRARIISLVFIVFFVTLVELPAVYLLGFWFLLQLLFGLAGTADAARRERRGRLLRPRRRLRVRVAGDPPARDARPSRTVRALAAPSRARPLTSV